MKIKEQVLCELARREFWYYCKAMYPTFYKDNRTYLKELCYGLQDFYNNDAEFMLISAPPRHGKSFTATNFIEWMFGKNPTEKVISGSYNEDLSKTFSKKIRDTITTEKLGENIVYSDIFPNTRVKVGSAEAKKWQTGASTQVNYLATSPTGSATGFGANWEVIDDLVKNGLEANNSTVLNGHWEWFTNTMLSRREGKKKVVVIMTRWNSKDLAGRLIEFCQSENLTYNHINLRAYDDREDTMLCDDIFDKADYERAKKLMGEDIFMANYQQEPIDMRGRLYTELMEYDELPTNIKAIENYTDTADTGKDFLASITYAVDMNNNAYVLDIYFTRDAMEITEPQVAKRITELGVNYCRIESNNGGRGFSRNVERLARKQGNHKTLFKPFTQSQNKQSRILTNATSVMQVVHFPKGWHNRWSDAYSHLFAYQREGKNEHDDIQDTITGVVETLEKIYKRGGNLSGRRI